MFATRSYIRALLEEVSRTPLDRTAARALVCALFDRNTPSFISEFLKDSFGQSPWQTIPKHLSFGILEEALDQRIEPTRSAVTRKLFRRLEAIAYSLEDEEQA